MLQIYYSNQLEVHKELIISFIQNNPLANPFEQEIILVQNLNIAKWLQIEIAQNLGIAANIYFSLPEPFIWDIFTKILPSIKKNNIFNKKTIAWKLMIILPSLLHKPEFKLLKYYINDDISKHKLYQLSNRIAYLFDKYLIYRSQWIESWHKKEIIEGLSEHQQWQKKLWLELIKYTKKNNEPIWHIVNVYQRFIQNSQINMPAYVNLPKRIFICGITTLPPIYLKILNILSNHIEIHLMIINICRHHFKNDIKNDIYLSTLEDNKFKNYFNKYEIKCFQKKSSNNLLNQYNQQFIINPLFDSWGKLENNTIYFINQLGKSNEISIFRDPPSNNLLHKIQKDILDCKDCSQLGLTRSSYNNSLLKRKLNKQDKSLTFHSCYNQQREVEVLHDYLLRLFEEEPTLTPKDIIVMMADIDNYTPYINSIFNNISTKTKLPFSISDRKALQVYPILQAFLSLLNLPQSRFTTEQVLKLLEVSTISKHFSIYDNELLLLRRWIKESCIRWGLNDKNISMLKLPVTKQNTWDFGLNRMLLGYTMDSNIGIWNNILPYDECSGLSAQLAGQLATFIDLLIYWKNILHQDRTLSEWSPLCKYLINDFFDINETTESIFVFILQQWHKIIDTGILAKYIDKISISLILDELVISFDNEKIDQFLTGAINFCSLTTMHSIPFKVVCLLGMNDQIYPRSIQKLGFNLILEQPQYGDKNLRDDDCYLFLETLNSASQRFYISYISHNIRNHSPQNPSILVNELLNYISQSFCLEGEEHLNVDYSANRVKEHLVTKHTKVPFAKDNYLPNSIHHSYAKEWLAAAKKQGSPQTKFCVPLLPIQKYTNEILLEQLISFYKHPIKTFFQKRLKVIFLNEEVTLSENEPFIVNNLQRYKFNNILLKAIIDEEPLDKILATLRATGELPPKYFANIFLEKQIQNLQSLANKIKINYHESFHKLFVESFDNSCLTGQLRNIQKTGVIRYRPAHLTINDGLSLWIEHLIFCLTIKPGNSYYWGIDNNEWCFTPVDKFQAKIYLQQLINGYKEGINSPLPLLNKSGWKWLMSCYNKKNNDFDFKSDAVLQKANMDLIHSLNGTYSSPGEIEDFYIYRAFGKIDNNLIVQIKKNASTYLLPIALFKKHKNRIIKP